MFFREEESKVRLFFCTPVIFLDRRSPMIPNTLGEEIFQDAEPIVKGMGFELVELRAVRTKTGAQVFAVVHRPQGVDHEACSEILKTLRPRIQMITESPSVRIEVSSPGMERVLKSRREFAIFRGRGISVLPRNGGDWVGGVVAETSEEGVELDTKGKRTFFSYEDIRKAKLDHTQEVR